jgi:TolB-like protein
MLKHIGGLMLVGLLIYGCASTASDSPAKAPVDENFQAKRTAGSNPDGGEKDSAAILADAVSLHLHKLPNRRLTVADFTEIDGDESAEGKLLAEQITTRLSQIEGLRLVERRQLNKILDEQKLSLTGITVEDGQKIGQVLNVDAILSGTIADLSDHQEINARIIDAATGEILCAVSHRRANPQRQKELARLPETQRVALSRQNQERRAEQIRHPELYRLKEAQRRDLLRLKNKNPRKYHQVVRTIQTVERIRRQDSAAFLWVTAPPQSTPFRHLRTLDSNQLKQLKALRRDIGLAVRATPTYKDLLSYQRNQVVGAGSH